LYVLSITYVLKYDLVSNFDMKLSFFMLCLFSLIVLGITSSAYAEEYAITIPTGASDENAPYFWSEKSTGVTTGEKTIFPGDYIIWKNADTAFHTITSVTQSGEEDDLFDSGFFTVGKSYTRQFNDYGDFYYYCSLHPWMNGIVHVVSNTGSVQSIDGIASGLSSDGLGFEVKYILDTNLANAVHVNSDEKTLTFTISGSSETDQITLILPEELIENPNSIWIDGEMVTSFQKETTSSGTKLVLPIDSTSREIKIMGSYVIPEFGFLAISILSISIMSILFLTRSKLSMFR
jgi:predicted secreted protein with PEFG-CTERM motif